MMKQLALLTCFWLLGHAALADLVYRSVDERGNVTYSSEPIENAIHSEKLEIPLPPSIETQQRAQEDSKQLIERADKLVQQRLERDLELAKENKRLQQAAAARKAEEARMQWEQEQQSQPVYIWPRYRPYPPYWGGYPHPTHRAVHPPTRPRSSGRFHWPKQAR